MVKSARTARSLPPEATQCLSPAQQRRSQPQQPARQRSAQPRQRKDLGSSRESCKGPAARWAAAMRRWCWPQLPPPPPAGRCAACTRNVTLSPCHHPPAACRSALAHTSIPCSWRQPARAPACARPPICSGHAGRQAAGCGTVALRRAGGLPCTGLLSGLNLLARLYHTQLTCLHRFPAYRAWNTAAAGAQQQQQQPEDSSSGNGSGAGKR